MSGLVGGSYYPETGSSSDGEGPHEIYLTLVYLSIVHTSLKPSCGEHIPHRGFKAQKI